VSTAYYDIYQGEVFSLCETIVVHSSATAVAINNGLIEQGIAVDTLNPASWKYYLNLQGIYHESDQPMSVISLDTLQIIPFTVDNLLTNRATAREYVYGSAYYNALLAQYPNQENLIRGVLNPVTLVTDVDGNLVIPDDGTILYYDPTLVEEAETNLIDKLQTWIYAFYSRWNVGAYALTDALYPAAQLIPLFAYMPMVVLNIRLANCKTRFAHSYHIGRYLASNGNLDAYLDSLTTGQALWLYRNIQYLKRNAGKQSTFQWLMYNILTVRGLPLAEWNMTHDLSNMPQSLYPTPTFTRTPLNFGFSFAGTDTKTLDEIFDLENPVAKDNQTVEVYDEATALISMENSLSNKLKTKILESEVTDLTDAVPYTFTDTLLNHWMYWAASNRYRSVLGLTDTHTGLAFNLSVLDAFVLYLYAYNYANGIVLIDVPNPSACHVQRVPMPSVGELEEIVEAQYVTKAQITGMVDALPPLGIFISTEAFYDACLDVQAGIEYARALYDATEEVTARAQMEQMTQRCYCDVFLPIGGGTYVDWLQVRGLNFSEYSAEEWSALATQIITEATGIDLLNVRNLKDLQAAMLGVMSQLSSYSIQYIQTINASTIKVVEWNMQRVGGVDGEGADLTSCNELGAYALDIGASSSDLSDVELFSGDGIDVACSMIPVELVQAPCGVSFDHSAEMNYLDRAMIPVINFSIADDVVQALPDIALNLVAPYYEVLTLTDLSEGFNTQSIDEYLTLTAQDRQILKDRFIGAISMPLASAIQTFILDGLYYPGQDTLIP
jgi:hypothetical protein